MEVENALLKRAIGYSYMNTRRLLMLIANNIAYEVLKSINKRILSYISVLGDDAKSKLNIVMSDIKNDGINPYITGYNIVFTILVHSTLYMLYEGDLRVVGIMSELED